MTKTSRRRFSTSSEVFVVIVRYLCTRDVGVPTASCREGLSKPRIVLWSSPERSLLAFSFASASSAARLSTRITAASQMSNQKCEIIKLRVPHSLKFASQKPARLVMFNLPLSHTQAVFRCRTGLTYASRMARLGKVFGRIRVASRRPSLPLELLLTLAFIRRRHSGRNVLILWDSRCW